MKIRLSKIKDIFRESDEPEGVQLAKLTKEAKKETSRVLDAIHKSVSKLLKGDVKVSRNSMNQFKPQIEKLLVEMAITLGNVIVTKKVSPFGTKDDEDNEKD